MLNWIVRNRTDFYIKMELALNNLQRLVCHKPQPTNHPFTYLLSILKCLIPLCTWTTTIYFPKVKKPKSLMKKKTIRIYIQNIRIDTEGNVMLIMKCEKRETREGMEESNQKCLGNLGTRETKSTWKYWRNKKKKTFMEISGHKQSEVYTRCRHGYEKETPREKLNLF